MAKSQESLNSQVEEMRKIVYENLLEDLEEDVKSGKVKLEMEDVRNAIHERLGGEQIVMMLEFNEQKVFEDLKRRL